MDTAIFSNVFFRVLVIVLVILVLQRVSHSVIERLVRRAVRSHRYESTVEERKREDTILHIFSTAITAALWVIGVMVILSEFNVNLAALLSGAGIVGVVVGFGAQNTIRDYLAGIFIIAENQYRVGDIVTLSAGGTGAGVSGVVEEITIRITRLRDLDGNLHIVRNGEPGVITNRSIKFANVNVDIGVSYDASIDQVEAIINQVGLEMAGEEQWKRQIIEPIQFLRVDAFAESAVIIKALGKVKPAKQWEVAGDFRRRLKTAFDKAGISIPLPQRVVLVREAKKNKTL